MLPGSVVTCHTDCSVVLVFAEQEMRKDSSVSLQQLRACLRAHERLLDEDWPEAAWSSASDSEDEEENPRQAYRRLNPQVSDDFMLNVLIPLVCASLTLLYCRLASHSRKTTRMLLCWAQTCSLKRIPHARMTNQVITQTCDG